MRVHILLWLPNGTSCTAEMDQLFGKLKPACSKSALCVASKKMQLRMKVRTQLTSKGNYNVSDGENELMEEEEEVEVVEQKRQSICSVSFQILILVILLMAGQKTRWSCVRLISISRRRESSTPGKK